jgi:hypothetical protein
MRRTTIITGLLVAALASLAMAPAAGAKTSKPVSRAAVSAAAQRLANQSAAGLEELTRGAAIVDRSRTSVGSYLRHGQFRMGASFTLFGTNTVNGEVRPLRCVGYVEVVRAKNGRARVAADLTCPVS